MIVDLTGYKTGFCDRLKQVTFCIAVAEFNGDRLLHIKEKPGEHCPFRFIDLCRVSGFETTAWNEGHGETKLRFDPHVYPSMSYIATHKPSNVRVSDNEFLEMWLNSYQKLQPKLELEGAIQALNAGRDTVGLHVRMTDKVAAGKGPGETIRPREVKGVETSTYRQLMRYMQRERLMKVFLAADNQESKEKWKQRLRADGIEVVVHDAQFDTSKLRQTSGEDFIVDLFALASCRSVFGTTYSGVVRAATFIGGRRKPRFGLDHMILARLRNRLEKLF